MSGAAIVEGPIVAPERARPTPRVLGARMLLVVACALLGVRLLALTSALPTENSRRVSAYFTDAERYHRIATHQGQPYRDYKVEYPPVTLAFVDLVATGEVRSTLRALGLASFALDLVTLAALVYGFGRRSGLVYLVLSTPLFLMPFVYFRVDFLVVALTATGVALVKRRADTAGGAALALAVFAKLWPLVVLPVMLVERRPRAIVSTVVCGTFGALGWLAMGGTTGFTQVLTFRGAHGFQIESVAGGALRLFTGETPHSESGALRVGDAPFGITLLLGCLMLAGVAWVWLRVHRSATTDTGVVYGIAPLTAVALFMACSPLLSPQFVLWLVPFAAITWAFGDRPLAVLVGMVVVATMLLTQVYEQLKDDLAIGHAMLALRNGLLLCVVGLGIARLAALRRVSVASA